MSFSGKVKEELSRQISTARHCQIAEIAAILSVCGQVSISANDHFCVTVHTENVSVARKYFTLVEKTFNIEAVIHVRKNVYLKKSNVYRVEVPSHEDTVRILQATKFMSPEQEIADDLSVMSRLVIQKSIFEGNVFSCRFYQRSGERISSGNCLLHYGTGGTDPVYHERI